MPQASHNTEISDLTRFFSSGGRANGIGPVLSILIAARDDWRALDGCLRSIGAQPGAPDFEVIVADDGSKHAAPDFIRSWGKVFPLAIVRLGHAGVSAARNHIARAARGTVLLIVDADSRLRPNCLAQLSTALKTWSHDSCFQLRLVGDRTKLVGRAEDLRLRLLQEHLLAPGSRIRYLNSAGLALRRTAVDSGDVFDPSLRRGEDTLLLARLLKRGEVPRFVPEAVVEHSVRLSLIRCLLKDFRSGRLESKADRKIAAEGIRVRLNHKERLRLLSLMWRRSKSCGRASWFVLFLRQLVERISSITFGYLHLTPRGAAGTE